MMNVTSQQFFTSSKVHEFRRIPLPNSRERKPKNLEYDR